MSVTREYVRDSQIAHDDKRREINKRNVWLVLVFLAQFPSLAKLLGRDMDETVCPIIGRTQQVVDESLGLIGRQCGVEVRDELAQYKVGRHLGSLRTLEFLVLDRDRAMVLVAFQSQSNPGPGIDKNHVPSFP